MKFSKKCNMKFVWQLVSLWTLLVSSFACSQSIATIVVNGDDFSTLETAVVTAGLAETLSDEGPFTVFAPRNAAFDAVDQAFLTKVLTDEWNLHLREILLFHVTAATIESKDIADGAVVSMVSGEDLIASISSNVISISSDAGAGATVVSADIHATNGVIHVVDNVLLPSFVFETVYSVAKNTDGFSTLVSLIELAGLTETLESGDFTVLAPTDDAFAALDPELVATLTADTDLLTEVLLYHIVEGAVPSAAITSGNVATVGGANVTATVNGESVMINDATVAAKDVLASNGIVHVIDEVLVPSNFTGSERANAFEPTSSALMLSGVLASALASVFCAAFV